VGVNRATTPTLELRKELRPLQEPTYSLLGEIIQTPNNKKFVNIPFKEDRNIIINSKPSVEASVEAETSYRCPG
jgi:hypothetical protein